MILSIGHVVIEMVPFVGVLSVSILGFAQAFYMISAEKIHSEEFTNEIVFYNAYDAVKFSFEIALGSFDTTKYDVQTYCFFILAVFIELIVMLNVLIAIVSNSF